MTLPKPGTQAYEMLRRVATKDPRYVRFLLPAAPAQTPAPQPKPPTQEPAPAAGGGFAPPAKCARPPCRHEGAIVEHCKSCHRDKEGRHVRDCDLHDRCTRTRVSDKVRSCDRCPDYLPEGPNPMTLTPAQMRNRDLRWACAVTTVPSRRRTLLPGTLLSLQRAGFPAPRLFVDGDDDGRSWREEFGLEVTCRGGPPARTHGNWVLSAYELFVRNPECGRYAVFQDDLVCCRNVRQYLDRKRFPADGYLNLYLFPANRDLAPPVGLTGRRMAGVYPSNQFGRGAVALVFSREGLLKLLSHPHLTERPIDPERGHRSVDGGIVTAMAKQGWREYVHHPALVQHTGDVSSMGNPSHPKAPNFVGADFDATELLRLPPDEVCG